MSIVSDLQTLLDDQGIFWTTSHIYDRLNEAQIDVWSVLRHDIGTATVTSTANREFLNLPMDTIMIPQRIIARNYEWFVTNKVQLERDNREWRHAAPGVPETFVLFDADTLQATPIPTDRYRWVIEGVKWPTTEIGDSPNNDITAPYCVKQCVLYHAAASITNNTRVDLFQQFTNEYIEALNVAKTELKNFGDHNIRRLRPGKVVTRAHQGHRGMGRVIVGRY